MDLGSYLLGHGTAALGGGSSLKEDVMFGAQIRRTALTLAMVAATGMLGACITLPSPGGNPGGL